jgi:hypothetical protein
MARIVVGKICKSKEAGKADYIKIDQDISFTKGDFVNLESKASRLKSLKEAIEAGRISGEGAEKAEEAINKMPDWLRFELVVYKK